jgi:hypothetical protein
MAKSVRLINCRFVAKPSLFLEVFAGTGRSKRVKWAIMRTAEVPKQPLSVIRSIPFPQDFPGPSEEAESDWNQEEYILIRETCRIQL